LERTWLIYVATSTQTGPARKLARRVRALGSVCKLVDEFARSHRVRKIVFKYSYSYILFRTKTHTFRYSNSLHSVCVLGPICRNENTNSTSLRSRAASGPVRCDDSRKLELRAEWGPDAVSGGARTPPTLPSVSDTVGHSPPAASRRRPSDRLFSVSWPRLARGVRRAAERRERKHVHFREFSLRRFPGSLVAPSSTQGKLRMMQSPDFSPSTPESLRSSISRFINTQYLSFFPPPFKL
jgi:hypothetical protein